MKILVTGGRTFSDRARLFETLPCSRVTHLVVGDADGADRLARQWADFYRIPKTVGVANWKLHGRSAGPLRNEWMFTQHPEAVCAFPGGRGTADCIRRAIAHGVPIL